MTIWGEKRPGEAGDGIMDASENTGGPTVLLYDRPDWVKHPETGERLRVTDQQRYIVTCPSCHTEVPGMVTTTDADMACLDCPSCKQFVWFTARSSE